MKKRIYLLVIAAILVCGLSVTASIALSSSEEAKAQNEESASKVESTELIRTSQSWDGVDLPDYLKGKPEIVGIKYEIPPKQKLGMHFHPVMNFGILVQGDLTIISEAGKEYVVHEGEPVVEMVGTVHHGENRGDKPVVLYMFYLSQEGMDLSVKQ
jgi:quercetin dioxygenase-like cupin family protein